MYPRPNSKLIIVIKSERIRVNVIADVLALDHPVSVWESFLPVAKVSSLIMKLI
jgi:hypothetical protein